MPPGGGPAGNARLTAWTGLVLLALFAVEGFTLLSLRAMISVHIVIGAFLVPLLLLKTATTGWRIVCYYLGSKPYRLAGPPPLLLRILGPLVVFSGLAVLGTGLALIAVGRSSYRPIISLAGVDFSALSLHQASFIAWFAITTLHVLTRTVPALQLVAGGRPHRQMVAGGARRGGVLVLTTAVGIAVGLLVLHASGDWTSQAGQGFDSQVPDGQPAGR